MSGAAVLLACDWGTTNLRAWTLDAAGTVLARRDFPLGVSRLAPGEAARVFHDQVRPTLQAGDLPAMLCGMAGSTLGWTVAPYLDCPADAEDLARAVMRLPGEAPPVSLAPGLKCMTPVGTPDVLRGEETQIFGWLAADPARRRGRRLICLPGTHAKWVLVEDGRIRVFQTAMTGELFAILSAHSVLKGPGAPGNVAAFDEGVAVAGSGDGLASRLFSARARVVGAGAPAETTPSYLSGLLIGAEAASAPALLEAPDADVILLGDPELCGWYARALASRGRIAEIHDGEAAAVAGLFALHTLGVPDAAG